MNQNLIVFPCLALMLLTFLVLLRMFITRMLAVKSGSIDMKFFKTYDSQVNAPTLMIQASRNFTNLFEMPTLFYMLCSFALITQSVDEYLYTAAWIYVGLRCIHSLVHVTSNKLYPRMASYALSLLVLIYMGFVLGLNILKTI